jgi:hypothetical protein
MAKITGADAVVLAAQAGVALDGEAARHAAESMQRPLSLVDAAARTLSFEAEPSRFLLIQQRTRA